jgi:hypothetical protein
VKYEGTFLVEVMFSQGHGLPPGNSVAARSVALNSMAVVVIFT